MVASETVNIATGTPSPAAVRNSASSMLRAIPRRRCVGATVMVLIAQAGTDRSPGSVSSAIHELAVATGVAGSAALSSHTPAMRRHAMPSRCWGSASPFTALPWNPRVMPWNHAPNAAVSLASRRAKRNPCSARLAAAAGSMGGVRKFAVTGSTLSGALSASGMAVPWRSCRESWSDVLSNAIWMLREVDRASNDDTANVYYRCGSQQGKLADRVPAGISEAEFAVLTERFVATWLEDYRRLRESRQKNATRNLKKYFDAAQIATIVEGINRVADESLARSVLS